MAYPLGDYWVKHFEAISSSAHVVQEVSGKYIRMVWGKLRPGSWEEYERHYHDRVAGSTNAKGLQERQLLRSTEDSDEGISVSIWDKVDDLLNYERSEFRQSLVKEVEHLYRGDHWVKHQGNRVLIAPRFGTVAPWGLTSPGSLSIFRCYSQNSWESIGISTIR